MKKSDETHVSKTRNKRGGFGSPKNNKKNCIFVVSKQMKGGIR